MSTKRAACVVCGKPGRWLTLVGDNRVGVCSAHAETVRVGATVTGAALKAGIIAGMEAARPGLFEQLAQTFWTVKGTISAIRGASDRSK